MNKILKIALAVVPFLLSVGCTDPNQLPAEAAVKAAEAAAATLTAEVATHAPEQVKAFQEGLKAAKDAVAKKDWKGARAAAEPLASLAQDAVAAAKARVEALQKALQDASVELAAKVTALQAKVDELSKAKKLPAGVTKDAVAKAKVTIAELDAGAVKAKEQAGTDVAAAAETVRGLLAKAAESAASLKME